MNVAGSLCQQDVENLSEDGSVRFDNLEEMLTATGREELLLLARRFRGRFRDFFEAAYNSTDYQVSPLGSFRPIPTIPTLLSIISSSDIWIIPVR